jgi:predicted glycoside hydrolase/deacetylase ChbG (UPF0249 family)
VREKSAEGVTAPSPTWETLEAFARQSMRQLLQRMLEEEVYSGAKPSPHSLVERLGFTPETKVLLINADDAGLLHAQNLATIEALKSGLVGSATVMAPCPWFSELASLAQLTPGLDFGVHLTFTSEWQGYRWGPVLGRSAVPSLVDDDGYFQPDQRAFHAKAAPAEAESEGAAQIQKALDAGLDVSHLDMHMHALGLDPRFFEIYVRLARRFNVPVRFIPFSKELAQGQAERLRKEGILFPDRVIVRADQEVGESLQAYCARKLRQLQPGVTELYVHVALDHPDLRAMTGDQPFPTGWRDRVEEYRLFTSDPEPWRILDAEGIKLVRWREVREAQRKARAS